MPKSDQATVLPRVDDVLRLILAGAEFADIRQYASEQGWQVSERLPAPRGNWSCRGRPIGDTRPLHQESRHARISSLERRRLADPHPHF